MDNFFVGGPNGFQSLPDEMYLEIFRYLDPKSLKNVRATCKKWSSLIDNELPMSIVADDSQPANLGFVRKVLRTRKVKALRIRKLAMINALIQPKKLECLVKMEMEGTVHHQFFMCVLPRFPNLQQLTIREKTFLRALTFDQPFLLPNLKILNIYSPFSDEHVSQGFVPRHMELNFGRNVKGLLSQIRCPAIESLILDGDVDQMKLPSNLDWKGETIMEFLKAYSGTLRKVLIGESSIIKARYVSDSDLKSTGPLKLKSLHFSMHGRLLQPPPPPERVDTCRFLRRQAQLEYLNVGFLWYPFPQDVLAQLPTTMKILAVYWNSTHLGTFDMTILSSLVNLERLELTYDGMEEEVATNFGQIKACFKLKTLVMEQIIISSHDLESIPKFFPSLEMLYLFRCTPGALANQEDDSQSHRRGPSFGISEQALTDFLSMRKLMYLFVNSDDFNGDLETKLSMAAFISRVAAVDSNNGYHVGEEPHYPDVFFR